MARRGKKWWRGKDDEERMTRKGWRDYHVVPHLMCWLYIVLFGGLALYLIWKPRITNLNLAVAHDGVSEGVQNEGSKGNIMETFTCLYLTYILPETAAKHIILKGF